MPRRNWNSLTPDLIIEKIKNAGINEGNGVVTQKEEKEIEELDVRIHKILSVVNNREKSRNMIYFVMYDIENDKVRTLIAKYLIQQGCVRVQNSIFLADTPPERCEAIKTDLAAVQASYHNMDSILVVPVSSMNIEAMHIIGKNINLDLIIKKDKKILFL